MGKFPKFMIILIIPICVLPLLLLLFLLLSFTPLFFEVSESKLYGTYVAKYEFAEEKLAINVRLTINRDGTFIQEVTRAGSSKVDISKGTWTYTKYCGLIFDHNFMDIMDSHGKLKPNYAQPRETGTVLMPATRWMFRIFLGTKDKSNDVLYKKID